MIDYIGYGLMGSITYTIVRWGFWREKGIDYLLRHLAWGILSGLIVYSFNLPNSLTAFGMGYMGIDAAEGIMNRLLKKE